MKDYRQFSSTRFVQLGLYASLKKKKEEKKRKKEKANTDAYYAVYGRK